MPRKKESDFVLLAVILCLVVGGLVMVFSASANLADNTKRFGGPWFFLRKQIIWAAFGLAAMGYFSRRDYNRLKAAVWPVLILTVLMLAGVFLAPAREHVHRWLSLGRCTLQPSEFAKYAVALFLACYLDRNHSRASAPWGLAVPAAVISFILILIALEPDLGTPILIFMVSGLVIWIGGGKLTYLLAAASLALPLAALEIIRHPYRLKRVLGYMAAMHGNSPASRQLEKAIQAVGSGGWFGKGIGASQLKLGYLPTPHTDFIFPVVCEELGLFGALVLLGGFAFLLVRGLRVARAAPNLFGTLLASGITLTICLQAYINACMSIGLLPTKGMPMPFISYGGSSLLMVMAAAGVLLNIAGQSSINASYTARGTPTMGKDGPGPRMLLGQK